MGPLRFLLVLKNSLFRRRVFIALLILAVIAYGFILDVKFVHQVMYRRSLVPSRLPVAEFKWRPPRQLKGLSSSPDHCTHSVQGPHLSVDDQGFVCPMRLLLASGCCPRHHNASVQHTCVSCVPKTQCCSSWVNCVSCCLRPEMNITVQTMVQQLRAALSPLYLAVHEQFEFCTSKCRASSQSVHHENTYRDPVFKFCYGMAPPKLVIKR